MTDQQQPYDSDQAREQCAREYEEEIKNLRAAVSKDTRAAVSKDTRAAASKHTRDLSPKRTKPQHEVVSLRQNMPRPKRIANPRFVNVERPGFPTGDEFQIKRRELISAGYRINSADLYYIDKIYEAVSLAERAYDGEVTDDMLQKILQSKILLPRNVVIGCAAKQLYDVVVHVDDNSKHDVALSIEAAIYASLLALVVKAWLAERTARK